MAHSASIILAFLVNCCGIYIFRNISKATLATYPSLKAKYIFDTASYFLLIDMKLYPKTYRRAHWAARTLIEIVLGKYLFETWQCDFWFPLENFIHCMINKIIVLLRRHTPRNSVVCTLICRFTDLLTSKNTPEIASILFALVFAVTIMHGTRSVDFGIIKKSGVSGFAKHLKLRVVSGVKRIARSFTGSTGNCGGRCHRSGDELYDNFNKSATSSKSPTPSRASVLSHTSSYRFDRQRHACN